MNMVPSLFTNKAMIEIMNQQTRELETSLLNREDIEVLPCTLVPVNVMPSGSVVHTLKFCFEGTYYCTDVFTHSFDSRKFTGIIVKTNPKEEPAILHDVDGYVNPLLVAYAKCNYKGNKDNHYFQCLGIEDVEFFMRRGMLI